MNLSAGSDGFEEMRNRWSARPAHQKIYGFDEWCSMQAQGAAKTSRQVSVADEECITVSSTIKFPTSQPSHRRHEPGNMNGLEKRYAQHLELRRVIGEIRSWKFEPLKLRLAPRTFYSVDFGLVTLDGLIELHEAKGHWEDDARVKIKVAAVMFPEFKFVGVQWRGPGGGWKFEDFKI